MLSIRQIVSATLAALLAGGVWPITARAYLGSFEEQDGYRLPGTGQMASLNFAGDAQFYLSNNAANGFTGVVPLGAFPNTLGDLTHGADLSRYNAGVYGTNNSGPGGTAADIGDNTGLWTALAGGRLHEDIGAPLYQGDTFHRDYIAAYGYTSPHSGSQVLNVLATDVDLRYNYQLDSRDYDGFTPSLTNSQKIDLVFWTCPSDYDDSVTSNVLGMTFKDSLGQSLLQVGYTGDNFLQYRVGNAASWQTTTITIGTQGWSQISLSFNTASNQVSLSAAGFNDVNSILEPMAAVITNELIGLDALNVTDIQWDAVGTVGFKNFFDDFNFSVTPVTPVPEPGGAVLVVLAGLWGMKRRRSR